MYKNVFILLERVLYGINTLTRIAGNLINLRSHLLYFSAPILL